MLNPLEGDDDSECVEVISQSLFSRNNCEFTSSVEEVWCAHAAETMWSHASLTTYECGLGPFTPVQSRPPVIGSVGSEQVLSIMAVFSKPLKLSESDQKAPQW